MLTLCHKPDRWTNSQPEPAGKEVAWSEKRVAEFGKDVLRGLLEEMMGNSGKLASPMAYFLIGRKDENGKDVEGQVRLAEAFKSPEALQEATSFLRTYAADQGAHAACVAVPKSAVEYPQVWRRSKADYGKRGWQHGAADGFFLQLEAPKARV